jgi:putative flippase GtrA
VSESGPYAGLAKNVPLTSEQQKLRDFIRQILGEAARFVGYGLISYALGIALSAFFREIIGLREEVSVALTLGILFVTNFWLARRFVFRASGHKGKQFALFVTTSVVMRGVEYMVFLALLRIFDVYYLLALTLAMGISGAVKFLLYRTVVFRKRKTKA